MQAGRVKTKGCMPFLQFVLQGLWSITYFELPDSASNIICMHRCSLGAPHQVFASKITGPFGVNATSHPIVRTGRSLIAVSLTNEHTSCQNGSRNWSKETPVLGWVGIVLSPEPFEQSVTAGSRRPSLKDTVDSALPVRPRCQLSTTL